MKRRHFLQFAGSTLAALGVSQLDIQRQSIRYGQVLAQDTPRKLALLVGINDYLKSDRFLTLNGCVTDVELQKELLMHRFKFHENDIVTLINEQATRDGILSAFENHLIEQAKPGDVVVFHFSGHGSRILDPDPVHDDDLNSTLVPVDAENDIGAVDDIMGRSLFLLMSALPTDQVTAVLDTCYSGGGTRGNIRFRSAQWGKQFYPSDRELAFQDEWLDKLQLDPETFEQRREMGVAKGIVIASARRNQRAADVQFNGFAAGAFTAVMTQFLWQQTDAVSGMVGRISSDLRSLSRQQPFLDPAEAIQADATAPYFIDEAAETPPAEAVVTEANEHSAIAWLGGVHPDVVESFSRGAVLTVAGAADQQVEVLSRQGLYIELALSNPLATNTLLQEVERVIPPDLVLRIGIDPSLASQAADIAQRLNELAYTEAAIADPDSSGYDGEVHYVLSAMTPDYREQFADREDVPELNSIGLLAPDLTEWIPDSFYPAEMATQSVLINLVPKFRALLAARMMKLVTNGTSTRLNLAVTVYPAQTRDRRFVAQAFTIRGKTEQADPPDTDTESATNQTNPALASNQIEANTPIQIEITNREAEPIYATVVVVTPAGQFAIAFPYQVNSSDEATRIEPQQTLVIPKPSDAVTMTFEDSDIGLNEVFVLASRRPIRRAILSLSAISDQARLPNADDADKDPTQLNGLFNHLDTVRGETTDAVPTRIPVQDVAAMLLTIEVLPSSASTDQPEPIEDSPPE